MDEDLGWNVSAEFAEERRTRGWVNKKEAWLHQHFMFEDNVEGLSDSLKGQVGEEGDGKEDGGNPTSNVSNEG